MMQRWKKIGLIFCPDGRHPLMRSHAALPIPDPLGGDFYRIYFTSRDGHNRSRIFSLVVDINRPLRPLDLTEEPLLDLGELGAFDDSGVMLNWITDAGDAGKFFYYTGWNVGVTVPFRIALGVAIVKNGRVIKRYRGPTMERNLDEPHFVGSVSVLREDGLFRNWYVSCIGWEPAQPRPIHRYHIKYADSTDGLHWRRDGVVALDLAGPQEIIVARPSVLRDPDRYRMWFCYRGEHYRIGYAESSDGITWVRLDNRVGLGVSEFGWDNMSVAYPFVFDNKSARLMLYNGNEYGKTGFGLAVLE